MTNSVEPAALVGNLDTLVSFDSYGNTHKYRQHRHVLKSRQNTYKHRCNEVLRRKLKKYKLRQDGNEDQDVLDVSKILVSLFIKSPHNSKEPYDIVAEYSDIDEFRPKNYLFKMIRQKNLKLNVNVDKAKVMDEINFHKQNKDSAFVSTEMKASQEKKHTNAFHVLMDSRNKCIGKNSPGKDINTEHSDDANFLEKKSIKAKRQLQLQKMAEEKGSLKTKELEDHREQIIKKKMEVRAEKLKNMVFGDNKIIKKNKDVTVIRDCKIVTSQASNHKQIGKLKVLNSKNDKVNSNNVLKQQVKTLQVVDILNSIEESNVISSEKTQITKADKEFLEKLSPSLKKKESMLSYFKKLEKDSLDSDDDLIKEKLKTKKKIKKKKLSLGKNNIDDKILEIIDENHETNHNINVNTQMNNDLDLHQKQLEECSGNKRQKQKQKFKIDMKGDVETEPTIMIENRPKRTVKRPLKYVDDVDLSSSDEELHIFISKRKKHVESDCIVDGKGLTNKTIKINDTVEAKHSKKCVKNKSEPKSTTKLAPIFKKKIFDPLALEAKQKFLKSGVPDKLKKLINQQKNIPIESAFPTVVHVQQKQKLPSTAAVLNERCFYISEVNSVESISHFRYEQDAFRKLLNLYENVGCINIDYNFKKGTTKLLQTIKELYPKFPVYRTYRYLRSKHKEETKEFNQIDLNDSIKVNDIADITIDSPDTLNWTDKYKALSTSQILGNFESIKELKKWLVSWTENEMLKSKTMSDSDLSDFYQSDIDSRESMKSMNNLLILTGPTGCGKTSCIFAVAAELAMKVIEVNVSSKRTGKIMLQDLQEATRSHKVNRGTSDTQKSQEKINCNVPKKYIKRGRPKKLKRNAKKHVVSIDSLNGTPCSQDSVRTDMSLILIDDADIVFEQDDGFSSAIAQLVQCSKRPVILVTSSLMCPHLQRFFQSGKILKMHPLQPRMLGTWLDIMCLADNGICWPGIGAKFLNYFKGDIRKTINYLQFHTAVFISSTNEEASQNINNFKANIDDENSTMSWIDTQDGIEGKKLLDNCNIDIESCYVWDGFTNKHSNLLLLKQPLEIFNIWWSIPSLLGINCMINPEVKQSKHISTVTSLNSKENCLKLDAIANAIDTISLTDYLVYKKYDTKYNIASDPWYSVESHSVSEQESLDDYIRSYDVGEEICHTMVAGSIVTAQDLLCCEKKTMLHSPRMSIQRQKDKIVSRHANLTSCLSPASILDRRALALDYWSTCRTICRTEKTKIDNVKRNNRFCHYLKSVSFLCKSDTYNDFCHSLCSDVRKELSIIDFNE